MEVKFSRETEDGVYEFNGTLEQDEVTFLVEFAINHLLALGAEPFITNKATVQQPQHAH